MVVHWHAACDVLLAWQLAVPECITFGGLMGRAPALTAVSTGLTEELWMRTSTCRQAGQGRRHDSMVIRLSLASAWRGMKRPTSESIGGNAYSRSGS